MGSKNVLLKRLGFPTAGYFLLTTHYFSAHLELTKAHYMHEFLGLFQQELIRPLGTEKQPVTNNLQFGILGHQYNHILFLRLSFVTNNQLTRDILCKRNLINLKKKEQDSVTSSWVKQTLFRSSVTCKVSLHGLLLGTQKVRETIINFCAFIELPV